MYVCTYCADKEGGKAVCNNICMFLYGYHLRLQDLKCMHACMYVCMYVNEIVSICLYVHVYMCICDGLISYWRRHVPSRDVAAHGAAGGRSVRKP